MRRRLIDRSSSAGVVANNAELWETQVDSDVRSDRKRTTALKTILNTLGVTAVLCVLLLLGACGGGGDADRAGQEVPSGRNSSEGPSADILLDSASTGLWLTSDNEWSLSKTGSLSANTVTWNITATKTATTSGHLVVQGTITVTNAGSGPATIGNIVVNLQRRIGNSWVTKSSDIANATEGDDATTANIHKAASSENKASFSENSASGKLEFMDATNNTLFSLVPQVLIGSGETRTLLFSASFDNNDALLQLTPGTQIRAEVIVTFGNATQNGNSTANVDINGNGTIDADEGRVRSVPSRLGLTVPAPVNGNDTVTLTDTVADVSATGDVTYSNLTFNLGATSGTVTANVSGGASGGTITNCAHLTSADQTVTSGGFTFSLTGGVDLLQCSTVTVPGSTPPPPCTRGTPGCAWQTGNVITYTQGFWGDPATAAGATLANSYNSVYASNFGVLEVGIPGASGFSISFTDAGSVQTYLPQLGALGALTADLLNPTSSAAGSFGGEVVALQLNVDFSDKGVTAGSAGAAFGNLRVCGLTSTTALNGLTVRQVLALVNTALGGGTTGVAILDLHLLLQNLNAAFGAGNPSSFAQTNLINGNCP